MGFPGVFAFFVDKSGVDKTFDYAVLNTLYQLKNK